MKVARLCQASRTVRGEASRKTWQDDVEQGSGIQAVDGKGCAELIRRDLQPRDEWERDSYKKTRTCCPPPVGPLTWKHSLIRNKRNVMRSDLPSAL